MIVRKSVVRTQCKISERLPITRNRDAKDGGGEIRKTGDNRAIWANKTLHFKNLTIRSGSIPDGKLTDPSVHEGKRHQERMRTQLSTCSRGKEGK